MERSEDAAGPGLSSRWPELLVALFLAALGVVVIVDSLRAGIGWDDGEGPRTGQFPFLVGGMLLSAGGWMVFVALLQFRRPCQLFASGRELGSLMQMLVPLVAYVLAVVNLGIYLSSLVLIAFFMRRHGGFGWASALLTAAGVALAAYLLFERWFLVPLPKGPLELMLGF